MGRDLPSGTVTFLFTDVEGSTRLLHELGAEAYADALMEHRRVLRDAFTRHGGVEVDTQGDAFFVAFPTAPGALAAAGDAQRALAAGPIRVRMGLHTGVPHLGPEGYVGHDVHAGARIAAAGHGGQVLVSAATAALVDPATGLRDLGEHRLKDLVEPMPIFQLGDGEFPPLKTISNTNLPRPASSFIGRDREVAEVSRRLREGTRLLTLTGPGGTGKTRLAIEAAAAAIPDFEAGVFWVGLATTWDPALVVAAIERTVGARHGLAEHIGERHMLLVLDNLEQVIDVAPELAALVERCVNLALLVTSRERLRVRGEVEWLVDPLDEADAVALFRARAGLAAEAADPTITALCRALDNLPLPVELAAARTNVLSPGHILERLGQRLDLLKGGRDADPRQATLRATLEWSHELLTPDERRLFASLAVFRGGCTTESAEDVLSVDLDLLGSLVDKSLLRRTGGRFWMLETIRAFASERLAVMDGADGIHRRHADHFLSLAEVAEPHLVEESLAGSGAWLDRLQGELDNVRAAIEWMRVVDDGPGLVRLTGALSDFWCARHHVPEGRHHLEEALERHLDATPHRAKALSGAAHMARDIGDATSALRRAEEALTIYERLGDTWRTGEVALSLGQAAADGGDFGKARDAFLRSARALRDAGDEPYALLADRNLSWAYHELGERTRAREVAEQTLLRARELGNRSLQATILGALASRALEDDGVDEALDFAPRALRLSAELGDRMGIAVELCRCAGALALSGRAETAAWLIGASEAIHEALGTAVLPYLAAELERTLAFVGAEIGKDLLDGALAHGRTIGADEAVQLALAETSAVTARDG